MWKLWYIALETIDVHNPALSEVVLKLQIRILKWVSKISMSTPILLSEDDTTKRADGTSQTKQNKISVYVWGKSQLYIEPINNLRHL